MDRIWLGRYPRGVPAEVDVAAYRSIGQLFEQSVDKFRTHVAYVNMGTTVAFDELERLSGAFAAYLQSVLRLAKGTRIALIMPNTLQYPVALLGALRAGCVVVPCNPFYGARELEHQLVDSGAELVVVTENFAATLAKAVDTTAVRYFVTTQVGDLLGFPKDLAVNLSVKYIKRMVPDWRLPGAVSFRSALRLGRQRRLEPVDVEPEDIALLQYTGGTTGVPKAAMLSHGNIIANLQQIQAWLAPVLDEGRETVITALPLYHIFALTANCLLFLKMGATNVLITDPRDIASFVRELRKHHFSVITGVNTLFAALLNNPDFSSLDFTSLRLAIGGGMAVQRAVADKWKRVTGMTLVEAYGLTEASPAVTINPVDLADYNGAIGLPIPNTEVAILDEGGHELSPGDIGELCVRGPQVMKGYWKRPEETIKVMTADGFLRTGDLAKLDPDGFVRVVDRKKDMINVSGLKLYPNEIEDIAALCPGVLEAGAVGVPDATSGETVKLVVVRTDPDLTADKLIAHFRKHLAGYKVPRQIEFRSSLPKSPIGKVLRRALRDDASKQPPTST